MQMQQLQFPIEIHNQTDEPATGIERLRSEVYSRLGKLARGNDDISHVIVNLKRPAQGKQTPYIHEITIMVYMDGENVVVNEKGELLEGTLGRALDTLERQVRDQREKRRGR